MVETSRPETPLGPDPRPGATHPLAQDGAVAVGVMVVAAAAILPTLASKSIWLDEATSVLLARQPFSDLLKTIAVDEANMAFYFVLLQRWVRLLGESEGAVRLLSAIPAIGTVGITYVLGARLFGRPVGIGAAVLLALTGLFVELSQEARGYGLGFLLVASAALALHEAVRRGGRSRWAIYSVVAAAAVYAHLFAALAVAGMVIGALAAGRSRAPGLLASSGLVVLLVLPLGVFVATHGDAATLSWIPNVTWRALWIETEHYFSAGGPLVVAIGIGVPLLGLLLAWAGRERYPAALLAGWAFLPIVVALAASPFRSFLVARYLAFGLPAMAILAARALLGARSPKAGWVRPRAVRTVACVLVLGITVSGLPTALDRPKDDWRSATAFVLENGRDGDSRLHFRASSAKPFDYYVRQAHAEDRAPTIVDEPGGERLWLVLSQYLVNGEVAPELDAMLEDLHRVYRQEGPDALFQGIKIRLYVRRSSE